VQWNGQNVPTTFGSSASLTASVPGSLQTAPGNVTVSVVHARPRRRRQPVVSPLRNTWGIPNNDGLYNPVDGLVYVSVPSSAGPPLGNSVVSVDPATGSVGQPLLVGSEPNHLALSSDGATLWVGLDGAGSVVRVDLRSRTVSASGYLGSKGGIYDAPGTATALAALPGSSTSVAVSGNNSSINGGAIDILTMESRAETPLPWATRPRCRLWLPTLRKRCFMVSAAARTVPIRMTRTASRQAFPPPSPRRPHSYRLRMAGLI